MSGFGPLGFCCLLISFLQFSPLNLSYAETDQKNFIRVAVIQNAERVTLSLSGPFEILAPHTHQLLMRGNSLKSQQVLPILSGIKVGRHQFKIYGIEIYTRREAAIRINGRRFRGWIDIIRMPDLRLLIVNHLDIEDYLYGVLYHEVSDRWPMEALKAQALVSRTFALYQKKVNSHKDYDLTADIFSQVYGGKTSERRGTNKAVNLTRGKILTFQGDIFPTYYHATCGGHTEDASMLWKINIPPLKGVVCDFCEESPHFRWERTIPLEDIGQALRKRGYSVGEIRDISILKRNRSHRVEKLEIKDQRAEVLISGKDFRECLGTDLIRSTNFTVETGAQGKATFKGLGWGHGVGLCQWGANFMAKKGYRYEQILKYYYPGSEIREVKSINSVTSVKTDKTD